MSTLVVRWMDEDASIEHGVDICTEYILLLIIRLIEYSSFFKYPKLISINMYVFTEG